jgi:glycogen debranching enzyme
VLFSGDREFVRDIFPVVKYAIDGAIRFRIDENFYLVHKDNETWMNQSDGQILLSARGNRAVEIQSLWYTALMIGSKLASWNNDLNLEEYWYTIAKSLRENFQTDFWKPFRNHMYDYLDANGSPNRSIRPNILFAGSSSQLPEIQPLINDDIKSQVTNVVMKKLTFRYGTSTLWQEDRNFITTNFEQSTDPKPGNHHNGTIWHWLSGTLISNLLYFNLDEIAFYLYSYESNQILYEDAIGNFASFRDPHPIPQKESAILKKNLSSSMSLAEYVRNFYQDFIGYHPNAINQHIDLTPVFPSDLKYVSTNLPYANGWIHFQFSEEENLFKFEISKEGDGEEVNIEFQYPGFDRKQILLNEVKTSIKFTLDPTSRKSYSRYNELDWHFAQWE